MSVICASVNVSMESLNQIITHVAVFATKSIVNVVLYVVPVAFHTTFH